MVDGARWCACVCSSKSETAAIRSLQAGVVLGLSSEAFQTLDRGLC